MARLSLTEFLRTLLSLLSHRPRADQYSSLSPSAFPPPLSFFFSISNLPAACKHLHPVVRYLACIPAYYYTGLGLHITSPVRFAYLFQVKPCLVEYFMAFLETRNISLSYILYHHKKSYTIRILYYKKKKEMRMFNKKNSLLNVTIHNFLSHLFESSLMLHYD